MLLFTFGLPPREKAVFQCFDQARRVKELLHGQVFNVSKINAGSSGRQVKNQQPPASSCSCSPVVRLAAGTEFGYTDRMSMTDIQATLTTWPEQERGKLAAWLMDSLPPHSGEDAAASSIAEAVQRRLELDRGEVKPLSSDEFWASIQRERATWK
jgi:hypothetical protein